MIRTALIALSLTSLAACATTPDVYGPAAGHSDGLGYSDVRIEDDRWRITYTARASVPEQRVEGLALRRAGELALRHGYDWFTVVRQDLTQDEGDDSPVRVTGRVGQSFGSGGFRASSVGLGVSIGTPHRTDTELRMEIIAGRGEPRPEDAYSASAIAVPAF